MFFTTRKKLSELLAELQVWSSRKKCIKRDLLSLIGKLNFACRIIPAGRTFLRRLIDLSTTARLPHHHISLNTITYHSHLLLRGIKRTNGLSSRRRLPITMSVMRQLKGALEDDPQFASQNKLKLWSAFTLAFFAFLRSSEFTSPSSTLFNPRVHLCHSHISFTTTGSLCLQLKTSKTAPFRKGCSIILAPSGRSVCAVHGHVPLPGSSASPQCYPPLFLLNWAIPHQGQSHLNSAPPAPMSRLCHRILCRPQFLHWACHYRCRGWLTPLAYPDLWLVVQQLLHPVHQDTCLYIPESPCPASCYPWYSTVILGSKHGM